MVKMKKKNVKKKNSFTILKIVLEWNLSEDGVGETSCVTDENLYSKMEVDELFDPTQNFDKCIGQSTTEGSRLFPNLRPRTVETLEKPPTYVIVDTNVWLEDEVQITKLINCLYENYIVFVPVLVMSELDKLQQSVNKTLCFRARKALNLMNDLLALWNHRKIVRQTRDEASSLSDNTWPDLTIKESAIKLKRMGHRTKIFTYDKALINECFANPMIEIYHPEGTEKYLLDVRRSKQYYFLVFLYLQSLQYSNFKSLGMEKRKMSLNKYDAETVKKGEQILYQYYTSGPIRKGKIEEAATDLFSNIM